MPQEEKTKILASEWQRIEYQKKVSQVKEVGSQTFIKKEIEERKPALPETFNKTITLRAKDVALHTILARISEATGCNIVCDPDVNSIVLLSVDTQNLPVWRVLNTILFPLSYGFKVKDKDLVILSKETRTFKLNLPPDTQSFSDTISNESSTRSDQVNASGNTNNNPNMSVKIGAKVFVESKEEAISFWKDVSLNLANMISPKGVCSYNKVAGVVTVTDNPVSLDRIASYIDLVNKETAKQILVEVKILEVTLSNEFTYGIDWNAVYKKISAIRSLSLSTNFTQNFLTPSLFTLTASSPNDNSGVSQDGIAALIKALESQGKVEVDRKSVV